MFLAIGAHSVFIATNHSVLSVVSHYVVGFKFSCKFIIHKAEAMNIFGARIEIEICCECIFLRRGIAYCLSILDIEQKSDCLLKKINQ